MSDENRIILAEIDSFFEIDDEEQASIQHSNLSLHINSTSKQKEQIKDEICKCGDPHSNLHEFDCSLYCGQHPCDDEMIKFPKCDHRIHQKCLDKLLFTRLSSCPLCRSSINSWRKSKHYQLIDKEINKQLDDDTSEAIRLSLESTESLRNDNNTNTHITERDDNVRNNNRSQSNHRHRTIHFEPMNHRNRSRSRSRSRNRNNNGRHSR